MLNNIYRGLLTRINARRKIPAAVSDLYWTIKKYLPKDPIILEAGAHMGFDTYGLAKMWPRAKVYAFEPVPELYSALVKRVGSMPNVKAFSLALGERNGSVEMYVSGGDSTGSSSILKPTAHLERFPSVTFGNQIQVRLLRTEDWAKEQGVDRIDFIWLDMQGYEVNALKGMGSLLAKVSVIYTELCKDELYSGLVTRDEYIRHLSNIGFELMSTPAEAEISEGIFLNRKAIANRRQLAG